LTGQAFAEAGQVVNLSIVQVFYFSLAEFTNATAFHTALIMQSVNSPLWYTNLYPSPQ
jgi:hypothetical protein